MRVFLTLVTGLVTIFSGSAFARDYFDFHDVPSDCARIVGKKLTEELTKVAHRIDLASIERDERNPDQRIWAEFYVNGGCAFGAWVEVDYFSKNAICSVKSITKPRYLGSCE